ncbi:EPIDERMAL PATTERNING FACTOR-like protein 8 [Ziziphus jujuba]|uniref:Epidermal patterning factor-like protein n=2 Tax=Ziziphus jujuba TaxID=326968 RepID=A0A6P3Z138_ZIZJJ|nr:EPIDERMAL PATTERNING FACTOR-like protein 8 [Ziziphus jujuba]KAH7547400.1 hypothetical protein FEM48_Zijuj01G0305700 [Ziziphus jujuba var. spinosa]
MAPSSCTALPLSIKLTITVAFIFSLSILPPKSVGSAHPRYGSEQSDHEKQSKMALGSRPPRCVNKCFNCRPCMATLVIPVHQVKSSHTTSRGEGEDDSYYLLSWKCRCGNKLFQP